MFSIKYIIFIAFALIQIPQVAGWSHDKGKRVYLDEGFMPVTRNWHIKIDKYTPVEEWESMCQQKWDEHPSRCSEGWNVHTEYLEHDWKGLENMGRGFYLINCIRHTICVTSY